MKMAVLVCVNSAIIFKILCHEITNCVEVFVKGIFKRPIFTAENDGQLPKLFALDHYYRCRNLHRVFCKLDIQLMPKVSDNACDIWSIIEKTKIDSAYFDHSVLHHGVCLKSSEVDENILLENYQKNYFHKEIVPVSIKNLRCISTSPTLDIFDFLIMFTVLLLIMIVVVATKRYGKLSPDSRNGSKSTVGMSYTIEKIISCFSVRKNWHIIRNNNKKFAFIEGLRTLTMIIIITQHSLMVYFSLYIENPNFLENLMTNIWFRYFLGLVWFTVQMFFVLSAMLLAVHIMDIYEKNKIFTMKDVLKIALNRYCRLIVPLVFILSFHSSHIPQLLGDGVMRDIVENETETCRNYWFLTMFFINNNFGIKNMCVISSWYVAVDSQLYILSIFLFYFSIKTKIDFYKFFTYIGTIGVFFNIFWNYSHSYPAVLSTNPKSLVMSRHLSSEVFLSLYMSTHSNIASYVIGIIFGIIYSRTKNSNFSLMDNKFKVFLWYIISFGLPIFSLYLSFHEYSTFTNAVMGSILKPMYALGCATIIFGMMTNENLKIKKIFQWQPMVFLGNFTYSTYLFHFAPLLGKFAHSSRPIQVNGLIMVGSTILDFFSSYAIGIFMFFLLECPIMQLQKLFLPTVHRRINPTTKNLSTKN